MREKAKEIWNKIAPWWDEAYQEGNIFHLSFHRPLNGIFLDLFQANLVMTGFVEPVPKPEELPEDYLWAKLSEVPPAIISRWKRDYEIRH